MKTKQMKTSELTGPALDWAVAKCEALSAYTDLGNEGWGVYVDYSDDYCNVHYTPTLNWGWGGPIIERESIRLMPDQGATYVDCVWLAGNANEDGDEFNGEGPTPLIAAMRCYVASKLGDEVEIPQDLV